MSSSVCSISLNALLPRKENPFQCLPLYSILLALGNPTVNYFRHHAL
jgi:hypothetical protein